MARQQRGSSEKASWWHLCVRLTGLSGLRDEARYDTFPASLHPAPAAKPLGAREIPGSLPIRKFYLDTLLAATAKRHSNSKSGTAKGNSLKG